MAQPTTFTDLAPASFYTRTDEGITRLGYVLRSGTYSGRASLELTLGDTNTIATAHLNADTEVTPITDETAAETFAAQDTRAALDFTKRIRTARRRLGL